MKLHLGISLLGASFMLSACYEPFSNEDLEFLLATPQALSIDVPEDETQSLRAAQENENGPAKFYRDTLKSAQDINAGIFSILDMVDFISEFEPTVREDDRRIWGPFPADDMTDTNVELALIIDRTRTATSVNFVSTITSTASVYYTFSLVGRFVGQGDEAWLALFAGQSHPRVEGDDGQAGRLIVSFENIRALDPNSTDRGIFFVGFDTRNQRKTIELLADGDTDPKFEATAAFVHTEETDGSGTFFFALVEEQVRVSPGIETLVIGSRWLAEGQGRADVAVINARQQPIYAVSECWNNDFARVFLASAPMAEEFPATGVIDDCGPEFQMATWPKD